MDEEFEEEFDEEIEESVEEQERAMSLAQKRAEERILRNKVKAISTKVKTKRLTHLSSQDSKILKEAKKNKKLVPEVSSIYVQLAKNIQSTVSKVMSASPVLLYVGLGVLCLFLIIAVVMIVASLVPNLFPDTEGNSTGESMFGITGNDFYGARMVYKDDELANKQIIEDYVGLVELSSNEVEKITSVSAGGKNYTVTLDVTIELPNVDYDYSTFDEQQFQTEFATTYSLILEIAKDIYAVDNASTYAGTSLIECVSGIKYFGYANINEISKELTSQILSNTTIQASDENGTVTDGAVLNTIKTQISTDVTNNLQTEFALEKYAKRTEKLFVKDYILKEDDSQMSGITKENYIAMIFMPKKDVTFKKLSFSVGGNNLSEFSMRISNDGSSIYVGTDGLNLGDETNFAYIYETSSINIHATTFLDIDANNLNKLETPQSLFEIVKNDANYSTYLSTQTVDGVELLTYKKNGIVVETQNAEEFMLVEFETHWE